MNRLAGLAWRCAIGRVSGPLVRLDVTRATSLAYALTRLREQRAFDSISPQPRRQVYERIWRDAATALDADIDRVGPDDFEIRRDGAVVRVSDRLVPLDSPELSPDTMTRAGDKPYVHRLLRDAGIPVPESIEFAPADPEPAIQFLHRGAGRPVYVKPGTGSGASWGVTGSVLTESQLLRATLGACRYSDRVQVERAIDGEMYRLLFLDGELLDVVRRRLPAVQGDGRSTIRELVRRENMRRRVAQGSAGLWMLRIDLDAVFTLRRAGLGLGSVPERGLRVVVKSTSGENSLEDNETMHRIAPALVEQAAHAVRALGLRTAGVDVVTPSIDSPLHEGHGAVIEINEGPGLSYHYLVADASRATRVAVPILERCLEEVGSIQPAASA